MEKLFIYGTLGPGRPNEHVMTNIGGSWQDAVVYGTLHEQGWGAEMGYPGIVLSKNNDKSNQVKGFVFSSDNLASNWSMLDEFEGDGYQRVLTQVELTNGQLVDAYVYALKP